MKDLTLTNQDQVVNFIKQNYKYMSTESLKYAVEKICDNSLKNELTNLKRIKP